MNYLTKCHDIVGVLGHLYDKKHKCYKSYKFECVISDGCTKWLLTCFLSVITYFSCFIKRNNVELNLFKSKTTNEPSQQLYLLYYNDDACINEAGHSEVLQPLCPVHQYSVLYVEHAIQLFKKK